MKKKAFIFDFDGTLVDSMQNFADIAARAMSKRLKIDQNTARRLYIETSGLPFHEQLEVLFPGNLANKETAAEFEKAKLEGYFDEPLFDDAKETIAHLRHLGAKAIVSSNNFQHLVERYVGNTGVSFDMVLGFKDGFSKGRDHFAHVEKSFGIVRQEMAFVGDSIKDGERAKEFGIEFIAKEGTFTKKEFMDAFPGTRVIKNLSELKEII